jgi:hypothetical protein
MALSRDASELTVERIQSDRNFAMALFGEAIAVFLNGEADVSWLVLRDLVNGTIGFEGLATTGRPSKSLHRMLSAKVTPTMNNLTLVFGVLR